MLELTIFENIAGTYHPDRREPEPCKIKEISLCIHGELKGKWKGQMNLESGPEGKTTGVLELEDGRRGRIQIVSRAGEQVCFESADNDGHKVFLARRNTQLAEEALEELMVRKDECPETITGDMIQDVRKRIEALDPPKEDVERCLLKKCLLRELAGLEESLGEGAG